MRALFDIRPDERKSTFAAFSTLLVITSGHTLLETARDALFLAKMPASRLPLMYLVIVVVALGLSRLPRTLDKRAISGALVVAGGVTAAFYVAASTPSPSLLYGLYVWSGVFTSWVTVQIWTLLAGFTIEQAKRLYTFIGAGGVLGAAGGAFLARWAMMAFDPRSSLLIAAGLFALSAVPCVAISVPRAEPVPLADGEPEMRAGMGLLWGNAFARRVLSIVFVATVTVTIADYLFKAAVAFRVHDAAELGATFALFYAVSNSLGVVAQLLIAPWIFRRVLVRHVLYLFPILILLAATGVIFTPGASAAFLFAIFGLKGTDAVLRYSIHKTSTELLLVPVPDLLRERVKPLVDLLGSRGGQAAASLGILFLVAAGAGRPKTLTVVVFVLALVWISIVLSIRTLYLDVFRETLKAGGLTGKAELPELDLSMLETLFAGLNSSRDAEVLGSLELLAAQHRERLIPALILYHPSRDVVLRALEIFTRLGQTDFVPIADRLNAHPDHEIAAAALRARTAVLPDRALLEKRLAEACPEVAITALVALLARGWMTDGEAKAHFARILEHKSAATAAEFARSVRDIAARSSGAAFDQTFDEGLLKLAEVFADKDVRVRVEVARAMGARAHPKFLRALVAMLAYHGPRAAAREALLVTPGALEALDLGMTTSEVPRAVRLQIPRAMALFEPAKATKLLVRRLPREEDGAVRYKILRALVKLRRSAPRIEIDESILEKTAEATLDHIDDLRRWGAALASESDEPPASAVFADPLRAAHHILLELVRDKETHATQRVFLMLELLNREAFEDILRGLKSRNAKTRASSHELVENLVRPPLRTRILSLVADEKPVSPPSYEDALREILVRGGSTMRTLAEYRALEIGLDVTESVRKKAADRQAIAESLGKRLLDLMPSVPKLEAAERGTRAPA
jgi:ATP:ADP antiporter, AAA family